MSARDFGDDGTRDYLIGGPGAIGSLSAYSLIALFRPSNALRSATFTLRVGGSNAADMIIDSGKWFYGGDFGAGYAGFTPIAEHWIYAGMSHAAGSNAGRWHHRDLTAGGASVHGDAAFAVGNPGAITEVRLGDGDNECRGDGALYAVYSTVLSDAQFDAAFSLSGAAGAFGLHPVAMWLGDSSNCETDVTGGGAGITSTFGTVGTSTDPPGFNYALSSTVDMAGSAAVGGMSGAGALTRVVAMSGALAVGGISGHGTMGGVVAGRRPTRSRTVQRVSGTGSRVQPVASRTVRRV